MALEGTSAVAETYAFLDVSIETAGSNLTDSGTCHARIDG